MKLIILNLGFSIIIFSLSLIASIEEFKFSDKIEKMYRMNSERKELIYKKTDFPRRRKLYRMENIESLAARNKNSSNNNSDSPLKSMYRALNETLIVQDMFEFKRNNRKYDFKILDKELEEIFHLMLYKNNRLITTNSVRDFIHFFMNSYNNCDEDKDNVLSYEEFSKCMKNDKYLNNIIPIDFRSANYTNNHLFKKYDPKIFFKLIFDSLDEKQFGFLNFNDYMNLRLMAFSWRKCSVLAPYLEETDFECALEIVAGYKTLSRTLVRKIFFLSQELSNSNGNRAVDFLTYINIAGSIKLYSKINGKQDDDITRSEFNNALDSNTIPLRYNQLIINQMFELMQEEDKPNQGIDLQSFIFYDFFLKLFYKAGKKRPFFVDRKEFYSIFKNPLFPNQTLTEIYLIPQYEFTAASYQMYQYYNISRYDTEENFFYKSFLELSSNNKMKSLIKEKIKNSVNSKNNLKNEKIKIKSESMKKAYSEFSTIGKKVEHGTNLHFGEKIQAETFSRNQNLKKNLERKYQIESESENNFSEESSNKNRWSDFDLELFSSKVSNNLNLPEFKKGKNAFNITIDLNKTVDKIFNALDIDFDGYADFKEFAFFIHITHLFSRHDKYHRGKIAAGNLFDIYTNYADFPVIGWKIRENAKKFSFFDMNMFIDALDAYLILNIDSVAKYFYRLSDTQTLNEIEARKFLTRMNMKFIPEPHLNKCLRGVDSNNLPKYEWECCFIQGMTLNLKFYETMDNYLTVKLNNMTLSNTVFYNIDPRFLN